MTDVSRLPISARWLLRLTPMPRETRAEVQADLHELFVQRRRDRGVVHAYWRLYHDVASLWLHRQPLAWPRLRRGYGTLAVLRDVRVDLRYAMRLFARQPAILLLAIGGLSLGLGIATTGFSIMNAAALRSSSSRRHYSCARPSARRPSTSGSTPTGSIPSHLDSRRQVPAPGPSGRAR